MKFVTVAVLTLFVLTPLAFAKEDAGKNPPTSLTFKIGADAKIVTVDKKAAALADLKVGDKIGIAYNEVAGANVVTRIHVIPAGKKPVGEKTEGQHKKQEADTDLHARGTITAIDAAAGTLTADVHVKHPKP